MISLITVNDYKNVLDNYDTWLFDCDGVLWRDDQVIDGVTEVLGLLRRQGELYCCNSTPQIQENRQKDYLRHKQRHKVPEDVQD